MYLAAATLHATTCEAMLPLLWAKIHLLLLLQVTIAMCPVSAEVVSKTESWLASLVSSTPAPHTDPPYPLSNSQSQVPLPLEKDMHKELSDSWEEHHKLPVADGIVLSPWSLKEQIVAELVGVEWLGD